MVTAKVLGIEKFNTEVFEEKIDKIIVPQANRLLFLFNDGHTIEREWKDRSRSESWSKAMREKARQKALERKTDNGKNSNGYTGND